MHVGDDASHLLELSSALLKPFAPQLQRTFVKCLDDTSGKVKELASKALSLLVPILPRLDPLVSELVTNLKDMEQDKKPAYQQALRHVLAAGQDRISPSMAEAANAELEL